MTQNPPPHALRDEDGFWINLIQPWRYVSILWRHRPLLSQFIRRAAHAQHKGSVLGMAWMVLNPLLMMAIYTLVFGIIFEARYGERSGPEENQWTYGLGLFLSLTLFQLFAEALAASPMAVISQPNLCKKVVFPLEILPTSAFGVSFIRFAVSLGLSLAAISIAGGHLTFQALWLPVIIAPLVLLSIGITFAFSAIGVFIRDLLSIAQFLTLVFMYGSALFYSSTQVELHAPLVWRFMKLNPLMHIIEESRHVVLWGTPPNWDNIGYAYLCGAIAFGVGFALFSRLKGAFSDVL